jgi:hypothetical protein
MKKFLLFLSLCFAVVSAQAKVYTVDNTITANDAAKFLYSTLQEAHNNAAAGDTIYILGSTKDYTGATFTKKIILFGPGYLLDQNSQTQGTSITAKVGEINLNSGSAGSQIYGIEFKVFSSGVDIAVNDIIVCSCLFTSDSEIYLRTGIKNVSITKNIFLGANKYPLNYFSTPPAANILFTNNIVFGPFAVQAGSSGSIINNTFLNNTFTINSGATFEIHNNILLGTDKTKIKLPTLNEHVTYNISTTDVFGSANGNQALVAETDIFVGTGSTDGKYQIKANGPADSKGINGTDIGAFGGNSPYILSGLAPLPAIYELTTTGTGNATTGLTITVKAKGN